METRVCAICKKEYPFTMEYYGSKRNNAKLTKYCINCRDKFQIYKQQHKHTPEEKRIINIDNKQINTNIIVLTKIKRYLREKLQECKEQQKTERIRGKIEAYSDILDKLDLTPIDYKMTKMEE